jgi:uncharacterized protein (TIGR00290 family)
MEKVIASWSGGKDSALAIYETLKSGDYEIVSLLTTINRDYDRVSMHGVPRVLAEQQAESLGLPIKEVMVPKDCTEEQYEMIMNEVLKGFKEAGISRVVYGDIFLEWIRDYRTRNLAKLGMEGIFPIWGRDTRELSRTFVKEGFKAVLTCVDTRKLAHAFLGRVFDEKLLAELPSDIDPNGENGEFHSFVFAGPIFKQPVRYTLGSSVTRNSYAFQDLLPGEEVA